MYTLNNGKSSLRNLGKLTSLILRNIKIFSSTSGYFIFKLPAAIRTDFTALIP